MIAKQLFASGSVNMVKYSILLDFMQLQCFIFCKGSVSEMNNHVMFMSPQINVLPTF